MKKILLSLIRAVIVGVVMAALVFLLISHEMSIRREFYQTGFKDGYALGSDAGYNKRHKKDTGVDFLPRGATRDDPL